jgi:hypothetical protein
MTRTTSCKAEICSKILINNLPAKHYSAWHLLEHEEGAMLLFWPQAFCMVGGC